MKKIYYVQVDSYNYFAGRSRTETKKFDRIIDAFAFQKKSASHDFDYDDAYQSTGKLKFYWDTTVAKTNKHRHIKKGNQFSSEEIDYLLCISKDKYGDVPFV